MNIFSKLVTTTLIAVSANFTGKAMPPQDHPPMVAATESIREYAPLDDARSKQSGDQEFSELTSQNLIVFPQGIPQIPLKDFQINFRIESVDDLFHPLTLCYPITGVRCPDVPRYTIRNIASSYCTAVSILEESYVREKFSMEKNSDPSSKGKEVLLMYVEGQLSDASMPIMQARAAQYRANTFSKDEFPVWTAFYYGSFFRPEDAWCISRNTQCLIMLDYNLGNAGVMRLCQQLNGLEQLQRLVLIYDNIDDALAKQIADALPSTVIELVLIGNPISTTAINDLKTKLTTKGCKIQF